MTSLRRKLLLCGNKMLMNPYMYKLLCNIDVGDENALCTNFTSYVCFLFVLKLERKNK